MFEKEAEEWAKNHHYYNGTVKGYVAERDNVINGYLAGAEPREKQIDELRAQIEKMKNCKNCKKLKKEKDGLLICTVGSFYTNTFGKGCDKWEIKENDKDND